MAKIKMTSFVILKTSLQLFGFLYIHFYGASKTPNTHLYKFYVFGKCLMITLYFRRIGGTI